jgi:hypothetical protein
MRCAAVLMFSPAVAVAITRVQSLPTDISYLLAGENDQAAMPCGCTDNLGGEIVKKA